MNDPPRWAVAGVLLASIALVWHSLGDHQLFPPDEGRYASVSGWMAEHGNWLAPQLRDHLHITKPPLAYWVQALCVDAFGRTEFAVRFPSAAATTALLLALFAFARRTSGTLVATLATGLAACMPLVQVVGRLAVTDPMLALWWWCALCAAWFALSAGRMRPAWVVAFWLACGLVGLTKGPLLLAPPAIVFAWLLLAGRLRDLRLLVPIVGLPLAAVPLAMVAYGFWHADPARAEQVWRFEFVERFTGGSGHNDPRWSLVLPFIAGFFPATSMLTLPWFNMSWARAWSYFRGGDLRALLLVAVVAPFVGFSALKGHSPTYLLPIAAPLALLVAMMLSRWVDGTVDDIPAGERPPDVRITSAIAMTATGSIVLGAAAYLVLTGRAPGWAPGWTLVWLAVPMLPAVVASWLAVAWWSRRALRLPALAAAFAATVAVWLGFHHAENVAMDAMGSRALAASIAADPRPTAIVGLNNLTIDWYVGHWMDRIDDAAALDRWLDAHPDARVVMAVGDVASLRTRNEALAARLRNPVEFDAWPMKRVAIYDVAR